MLKPTQNEVNLLGAYKDACAKYDAAGKAFEKADRAADKAQERRDVALYEWTAAEESQQNALSDLLDGIGR